MKKMWEEPRIEIQTFVPNEYVSACFDVRCNTPSGTGYIEKNGIPGYQAGGWGEKGDEKLASGYEDGSIHYEISGVPDNGPTANAMWQEEGNGFGTGDYYPVYYWRQNDGLGKQGIHFAKIEDADWTRNSNAS